jgi:hypothetical protein
VILPQPVLKVSVPMHSRSARTSEYDFFILIGFPF